LIEQLIAKYFCRWIVKRLRFNNFSPYWSSRWSCRCCCRCCCGRHRHCCGSCNAS